MQYCYDTLIDHIFETHQNELIDPKEAENITCTMIKYRDIFRTATHVLSDDILLCSAVLPSVWLSVGDVLFLASAYITAKS